MKTECTREYHKVLVARNARQCAVCGVDLKEYFFPYSKLSYEELERAYAINSVVDWYKCNLILEEMKKRKEHDVVSFRTIAGQSNCQKN